LQSQNLYEGACSSRRRRRFAQLHQQRQRFAVLTLGVE
jgi:hypothetical protein